MNFTFHETTHSIALSHIVKNCYGGILNYAALTVQKSIILRIYCGIQQLLSAEKLEGLNRHFYWSSAIIRLAAVSFI